MGSCAVRLRKLGRGTVQLVLMFLPWREVEGDPKTHYYDHPGLALSMWMDRCIGGWMDNDKTGCMGARLINI